MGSNDFSLVFIRVQRSRCPELTIPKSGNPKPEILKSRNPEIPKTRKLPGASTSCQELPGPFRSCWLPARSWIEIPTSRNPGSCEELPGAARCCQELARSSPGAARSCPARSSPGAARSCAGAARTVKSIWHSGISIVFNGCYCVPLLSNDFQ